jgi:hypothetical protein
VVDPLGVMITMSDGRYRDATPAEPRPAADL